jgi:hypothetical protein
LNDLSDAGPRASNRSPPPSVRRATCRVEYGSSVDQFRKMKAVEHEGRSLSIVSRLPSDTIPQSGVDPHFGSGRKPTKYNYLGGGTASFPTKLQSSKFSTKISTASEENCR